MSQGILQAHARQTALELSGETPEAYIQEIGSRVAPTPVVDEKEEAKIQMKRLTAKGKGVGEKPQPAEVRWQPHENVQARQPAGKTVYEYEENSHNLSFTASMCAAICKLYDTDAKYRRKPNAMGDMAPETFNGARLEMMEELKEFDVVDEALEEKYGETAGATRVEAALWELSSANYVCAQYGVSWIGTLQMVWNRVRCRKESTDLTKILHDAILECRDEDAIPCLSGKINRLIVVLCGFYDDIQLNLSDAEQIANIIIWMTRKHPTYKSNDRESKLLYRGIRDRLTGLGLTKAEQMPWLEALWPDSDDDDDDEPAHSNGTRTQRRNQDLRVAESTRRVEPKRRTRK